MTFDLFSLNVLDEDVERFSAYNDGVVIEDSCLEGLVAIVSNENVAKRFAYATCYLPEECRELLDMSEKDAIAAHGLKRRLGGTIKEKK